MTNNSYVWYACYGSNLSRGRFFCYISKCRDMTLPKDEKPIDIPYPLYFAKNSKNWHGKGVAFIGHKKTASDITHGKMYLITIEQFNDVVSQENANAKISIDFNSVKKSGYAKVCDCWYGYIVYLGEHNNLSIFTFTAFWDKGCEKFTTPSEEYILTIILGLKESYRYSDKKIANYLSNKPGIEGEYGKDKLITLSKTVVI